MYDTPMTDPIVHKIIIYLSNFSDQLVTKKLVGIVT